LFGSDAFDSSDNGAESNDDPFLESEDPREVDIEDYLPDNSDNDSSDGSSEDDKALLA